jgi:hypothetical protein
VLNRYVELDFEGLLQCGERLSRASSETRAAVMALPAVRAKFESMIRKGSGSECWPWLRGKNTSGYEIFCVGPDRIIASRASWEIFCGPIPAGFQLLHKCDVPACVNPSHLFLGTVQDNVSDMWAKGRAVVRRGDRNHASKLTAEDVIAIRSSDMSLTKLAAKYGISRASVSAARRGLTWSHIADVGAL